MPAEAYYGAQTMRSLHFFNIGDERMPTPVVRAFGLLKKSACKINLELGAIDASMAGAIEQVCGRRATAVCLPRQGSLLISFFTLKRRVMRSLPARLMRIFRYGCGRPGRARKPT